MTAPPTYKPAPPSTQDVIPGATIFTLYDHGWLTGAAVVIRCPDYTPRHNTDAFVYRIDRDRIHLVEATGAFLPLGELDDVTFTLARRYTVYTPYTEDDIREVSMAQDNDIAYFAHINHPQYKISRLGDTNWVFETVDFTPNDNYPSTVNAFATRSPDYTRDNNGTIEQVGLPTTYKYVVSTIDADTGEESLPSMVEAAAINDLNLQGAKNRISWSSVPNTEFYVVYKNVDGVYGFIGQTKELFFNDNNIAENTADGPQQGLNPFDGPNRYPRTVSIHDQRLTFAATKEDPFAVFMSKVTLFENFDTASPAKADDAVTFRIRAKKRQDIKSLLSTTGGLGVFTSVGEWLVRGADDRAFITPTNTLAVPQTTRGSYYLPPLDVGDTDMFAQRKGAVIRDFTYTEVERKYTGEDRTLMSRHLFKNREIVSWCYAQSPHSMVWVAMDDGSLLSLTYVREQQVFAWARHDVGGKVLDVETIPDDVEDAVYIVVERVIGSSTVYMSERITHRDDTPEEEWQFADSSLVYEGDPVSTVTGLRHLVGETVTVLADGFVLGEHVVDATGSVVLNNLYSRVVVGLPYVSEIETLNLDLGNVPELGVVKGRDVSIPNLVITLEESRGVSAGQSDDTMIFVQERDNENYGEPIAPFTGERKYDLEPDWTRTGQITIRQTLPLPMKVLSVAPEVIIGG